MSAAKTKRGHYVLYGSRNSGSAAVEAALELAKAPYRIVDAATWRKKDDSATFAQLQSANLLNQIATLVCPDGTVLTESAAVLIHLALPHRRARLGPGDDARRAQALRAAGVVVVKGPESAENGKFAWILDPDDNKLELWEPMLWDDKNKGKDAP